MSRTRKAALTAAYTYANFILALVSGFVLFPLAIYYLGAYDYGLWLITGELAGYLLLGDLGVFAVLPWLIAAKDGADDHAGIARYTADALAVGVVIGCAFVLVGASFWWINPTTINVNPDDWGKVRGPLTFVVVMLGVGFPLRAFTAVLSGLQDVTFLGLIALIQTALTICLTATLVILGYGLPGLAIATGVPPLLGGLAAVVRVFIRYRKTMTGLYRPNWTGCRHLFREGFGAWLASFGVRLRYASSGMLFALLGRPDWATVYAATGKVAQVLQPMCWVIPDSGLVGLSQVHGEGDPVRTRRVVTCMLLLYLFIPGLAVIGLLVANPWFVRAWLGPNYYAGNYVSALIAVTLLVSSATGGLFKVVGSVGYRLRIGMVALVYGLLAFGLSYLLGRQRGMAGMAEGSLIASAVFAVPCGLKILWAAYGIRVGDLVAVGIGRWFLITAPLLAAATWVGSYVANLSFVLVAITGLLLMIGYIVLLRPVVARAPWPQKIQDWLARMHLIPRSLSSAKDTCPGTSI